jgi:hypothetical protein
LTVTYCETRIIYILHHPSSTTQVVELEPGPPAGAGFCFFPLGVHAASGWAHLTPLDAARYNGVLG